MKVANAICQKPGEEQMSSKLAVQMYTVRDFTKTARDLSETLRKVREMGYPAVQLSAVAAMNGDSPEVSAADAKKMLDDNGLRCIATHRSWDDLTQNTEKEIEFHHTLGCNYTAIGSIPGAWEATSTAPRRRGLPPLGAGCTADYRETQSGGHSVRLSQSRLRVRAHHTGKLRQDPQTLFDISSKKAAPT
jgi:hypothetical protein